MKKLFTALFVGVAALLVGCHDPYDDTAINDRIDNLEDRVTTLEEACKKMNTNISSLQTIVEALQQNDYITGVTPITEGEDVVGYTISFAKGGDITIYNGEDGTDGTNGTNGTNGADGYTPEIGVAKDTDGIYYWTLDGEWLTDAEGNKIQAEGTNGANGENGADGADGATPELKIEEGYWYISYDNGTTWEELGKATADAPVVECIFKSVTEDEKYVYFTLQDDSVIAIAKVTPLTLTFEEEDLAPISVNTTRDINYTVEAAAESVEIELLSSTGVAAEVVSEDASLKTGAIRVTTGATIDSSSKVVVLVSDGERVIMKSIKLEEAGLVVEAGSEFEVAAAGGEQAIAFMTNVDYEVVIPEAAASWISVAPETRAMEKKQVTLVIARNLSEEAREAVVTVKATDGELKAEYKISQKGLVITPIADVLALADGAAIESAVIKGYVISNYELNNLTSKKGLYVQDNTGGLQFYLAANHELAFGTEVIIDLSGSEMGSYNGAVQISGLALDKITTVSTGNTVEPKTVTMADFLANKYEGQYIAIDGVQVASADLSKTWVVDDKHTSINIEDAEGNKFVVFSSKYASYGAETVAQGSGTIKGISSINNGAMQIIFAQAGDFAGLTGERFTATEPEPEPEPEPGTGTYTMISKVANLSAGTYFMAGYLTEYNDSDWSSYPYHVCTGVSTDLYTDNYSFVDGELTKDPSITTSYEKSEIELIAVDGKANTYYIKFVNENQYLYSSEAATNRKLGLTDTATEWVATDNANGGITLSSNSVYLGTAGAASKLLRSYKGEGTLKYGVVFFKANDNEVVSDGTMNATASIDASTSTAYGNL